MNKNVLLSSPVSLKIRASLRVTLVLLVYLILFVLLDRLALAFQVIPGIVAWYLPSGLSFALLLVFGVRFVPALTLASLISSLFIFQFSLPLDTLFGWAVLYSLTYGLAAWFLRRIRKNQQLFNTRDLIWFILSTLIVSVILATASISALVVNGMVPETDCFSAMVQWWIGEVTGILSIAPALLIHIMPWVKRFADGELHIREIPFQRPSKQVIWQALALLLMLFLIFGVDWPVDFEPLFFVAVPLIWIALRSGISGVSLAIAGVNFGILLAIWILRLSDSSQLGQLQVQMLIVSVASLLNGSIITDNRRAETASDQDATDEITRRQKKVVRELIMILISAVAVWILEYIFDLYELVTEWEHRIGLKGLEATLVMAMFLGFAFAFFSYRRWREIRSEVQERQKAEAELSALNRQLEQRVRERTADLSKANQSLQAVIAERKQAEETLQRSEKRFRALVEHNADAITLLDADGVAVYDSPAAPGMLGYGPDDWIGQNVFELLHPDDIVDTLDKFRSVTETPGARSNATFRLRHKSGSWLWIEAVATNLLAEPSVEAVVINYRDITDRRQAEEKLRASEDRYRDLVENSQDLICTHDLDGQLLSINPHTEQVLGYPSGALLGTNIRDGLAPDTQKYFDSYLAGIKRTGFAEGYMTVLTASGEKRIWEYKNTLRTEGVTTPVVRGMARDVTEQKMAEEALRESDEHLRSLFENTPISIWEEDFSEVKAYLDSLEEISASDPENFLADHPEVVSKCISLVKVLDVNQASLALYGAREKTELLGYLDQTLTPDSYDTFQKELVAVTRGVTKLTLDTQMRTIAGLQRFVALNWAVVPGHEKTFSKVLVSLTDITERKQAEEEVTSRTEELLTLYGLSRALASADDLDEILTLINRYAVESIHITFSRIALLEGDQFITRAAYPIRVLDHDLQIGVRESANTLPFVQNTLDQDEPVILHASNSEVNSRERAFLLLDFAQALCLMPLRIGGGTPNSRHTIGLLMLGEARSQEREPFTQSKLRLAQSIGDQAGVAIRRRSLHEQTESRLQQLAALRDIDQAIASSFDFHLSARVLLLHVTEQLGVDAAAIWVFNPDTRMLEFKVGRGFRSKAFERAKPLSLGEGYAGRTASERHMIHVADLAAQQDNPRLMRALENEMFVDYYGIPLLAKGSIKGVLEVFHRTPLEPDEGWLDFLNTLAGQAAIAIDNAMLFENLQRSNEDLFMAYERTLEGWSAALDLRDKETEGHTQRVTETTVQLAKEMGFSEQDLTNVRRGALLHDIGKMGVPDRILLKPDKLTDEEWVIMRKHPVYAYELLKPIAYLRAALDIPYCHHEKWDGTGYPRGLKGEEIPFAARIFSVIDVWDALSSDRPYRDAWPQEKVMTYLQEQSGSHFDPQVVEAFISMMNLN